MMQYIVTEIENLHTRLLVAAAYEDMRLTQIRIRPRGENTLVGRVYIGHLENRLRNTGGAFLRSGDVKAYLPEYVRRPGDDGHILFQITKDAIGKKAAVASRALRLAGRYVVVSEGTGIQYSSKLKEEDREFLKTHVDLSALSDVRILYRTNAMMASSEILREEAASLRERLKTLLKNASGKCREHCLYAPQPFYIELLRDLYEMPERIQTDIPAVAEDLVSYIRNNMPAAVSDNFTLDTVLRGHEHSLSLASLYNLDKDLHMLSEKRVWLRSGAFLVIEPTEAFVSIDVNSGHYSAGRQPEDAYRDINLEAGEEIIRQIRLRNLSGVILVDFINMASAEAREELVAYMRKIARGEQILTQVIDLTPLGIMEIVRQKKERPVADLL